MRAEQWNTITGIYRHFSSFGSSSHIGVYRRDLNSTKGLGEFFRDGEKVGHESNKW
jgi:hypothetical protein